MATSLFFQLFNIHEKAFFSLNQILVILKKLLLLQLVNN